MNEPAQNQTPPPAPFNQMGCLIAGGIIAGGLVLAAFIIGIAISSFGGVINSANPANVLGTAAAPRTPTVVARPPMIQQVKALADLTTVQTLLSTIVEADQARVGNVVYERLILLACGRVKAGVDLSKMTDADITVSADGKTARVHLPKAQLLDTYLIDDPTQPCTTKVYDRTNLILLPASKDLEGVARDKAVKAITETAVQAGIIAEADKNARAAIERILINSGFDKVEFVP
ncbi:MAG TPA: DUF4230 domain-containing protein [Thermoflexales bacterium]|nr:DUF4230 domain-containing protein [Thermoflexales bacterium]HQW35249.1 DUF4230 domain-containing protein [Thermoflexales bacterium]HRA01019.1 DUF4230 domain-containing protein [Thermoflexales bacterium]